MRDVPRCALRLSGPLKVPVPTVEQAGPTFRGTALPEQAWTVTSTGTGAGVSLVAAPKTQSIPGLREAASLTLVAPARRGR